MSLLGFILECAAAAAVVGSAVGLLSLAGLLASWPLALRLSAAARSDLSLLSGLMPALAAMFVVVSAAAPSVGSALGVRLDHCPGHDHHFHICFIHAVGLRPALATIGAFSLVVWIYRLGALTGGLVRSSATARVLEGLARPGGDAFPVLLLPGSMFCHATGLFRRRILLSSDLAQRLSPGELAGALAHEEAHLRRRDPLASFLLAAAALFVPPPLGEWFRRLHRHAAEEACDATAANVVGDGAVVAAALVKVAALQREAAGGAALAASAFGTYGLESRVKSLLDRTESESSRSRWVLWAVAATVSFASLTYVAGDSIHHGAETILGRIF